MATPKHASNQEMKKALADLPEEFLACRDPGLRHPWAVTQNYHVPVEQHIGRNVASVARTLTCTRCEAVKTEYYRVTSLGLEKFRNAYDYKEGYLMKGIARGVKPSILIAQVQYERAMETVAKAARGQQRLKVV